MILFEFSDPPRQIAKTDCVFHLASAGEMLTIGPEQGENGALIGHTRQRPPFTVRYRDAECRYRFGHEVDGVDNLLIVPLRRPQQWFDQIGYLNSMTFFVMISFVHAPQNLDQHSKTK